MPVIGIIGAELVTMAFGIRFDPVAPLWFVLMVCFGTGALGMCLGAKIK
jgi:hypothetical protein